MSDSFRHFFADLKTVHDLEKYIQEQYVSTVSSGVGLETTMQTLVTVTLHFMSQGVASSCPQVRIIAGEGLNVLCSY